MSEQPSSGSAILNYVPEHQYVGAGRVTIGALLLALCGGGLVAVVAGLVTFVWMISRVLPIAAAPGIAQGLAVGGALGWLFHRLEVRSATAAVILGIVCGVVSTLTLHSALYVRNVYSERNHLRGQLEQMGWTNDPIRKPTADAMLRHPFRSFDSLVVFPQSQHHWFFGYMVLRWPKIRGLMMLQLLVTTVTAAAIGRRSVSRPFCEDCGSWFKEPVNAAVLPIECARPLADAVASDDPARVYAVHAMAGEDLGVSCAVARVHTCPSCGKKYVDVVGKAGARVSTRLGLRRATPEMIEALRYERPRAVLPAEPPPPAPVSPS